MQASDIMTSSPCCCSPNDTLRDVAQTMRDNDCGAVPIVDGGCIVGIVTDRDLAVRALADGRSPDARVGDVITRDPCCCSVTDDLRVVEEAMADNQVRRIPIVDGDGCCVGIVTQADLARAAIHNPRVSEHEVAFVVERISEPRRHTFNHGANPSAEQRL
jgi:CBS domain-containing protein